ncbi:MFS transporter [Thiotrichales bacterium 19S3-7]|nr:MFS transporter [Thiotrichales bacterium 19S3-7]MCF6801315.1 MFS transporter [Thiotrichales bacterium 19S3-11]
MSNIRLVSPFIVAVLFSGFSLFLQVSPISTSGYYSEIIGEPLEDIVHYTSLYFVAYAILQIPVGISLDKLGVYLLLPLGLFITFVSCILHWISQDVTMLAISRLLTGTGCAVAYISAVFIAANTFQKKYLAICIAIIEIASTIGALIAGSVLDDAIYHMGWNASNIIIISFAFVLFLLSIQFVYKQRRNLNTYKPSSSESVLQSIINCFILLRYKKVLAIVCYCFLTWMIIMSFAGFWIKNYFMVTHEYSTYRALWLSQIYWVSFLLGSLVVGKFAKNIKSSILLVMFLALLNTLSLGYFIVPWMSNFYTLCLLFLCSGIAASGIVVALSVLVMIVPEEAKGSAIALTNTFIVLGGFIGQIVFGYMIRSDFLNTVVDKLNPEISVNYYSAIFMLPCIALISLIIFVLAFYRSLVRHY